MDSEIIVKAQNQGRTSLRASEGVAFGNGVIFPPLCVEPVSPRNSSYVSEA